MFFATLVKRYATLPLLRTLRIPRYARGAVAHVPLGVLLLGSRRTTLSQNLQWTVSGPVSLSTHSTESLDSTTIHEDPQQTRNSGRTPQLSRLERGQLGLLRVHTHHRIVAFSCSQSLCLASLAASTAANRTWSGLDNSGHHRPIGSRCLRYLSLTPTRTTR
ncbi:hypothetical protein BDP81DRAFT_437717 [Colletotrichum phormii]|uniref:Uncharacterized protein n=1 Tax=Colletotrichum phormii TaxID=359342 RepID=A0AAJ0ECC8_9PEZI|nr:uncharacterized protein BDP81DRAFT_437717 [Colletotrichum phormii]KAK1624512.1 hypothetical protein BDP81DRAFT_437717 [Colletotrichum phormii]